MSVADHPLVRWIRVALVSGLPSGLAITSLACTEIEYDRGHVCVEVDELADGRVRLLGTAESDDCAADHRGASFECSISLDGTLAHIDTEYRAGRDPDSFCAGPIVTTCAVEVPDPGDYTLEFAGERETITVPSEQTICLPYGFPDETTG